MRRDPILLFVLLLAFSSPALAQPVVSVSAADWIVEGDQPTRTFGWTVAAGDIDGDGYDDVLIGDPFFDGAFDNSGRITIHRGSAAGLSPVPDWSVEGAYEDERLGRVSPAGDANGDGFDDFIVFDYSAIELQLILGSAAGPSERTRLFQGVYRGHGDVNGDGFSDIGVQSIGARLPRFSLEQPDLLHNGPSKVHLFMGSASGLRVSPSASFTPSPRAGWVHDFTFEDLNGDGYSDLVAEGTGFSIYLGSSEGLRARPNRIIDYSREDAALLVSAAGDVNGDGFGDLAVNKYSSNEFGSFEELLLFWGSASGIRTQPSHVAYYFDDFFLRGVTLFEGAGDLNGDGFGDLMIRDGGTVKVLSGSASGLLTLTLSIIGGISTASSAGDVNGDGYGDIVLVSSDHFSDLKRVYVFLGEPSP